MDRAVALAKGKRRAEHRLAHAEALALARSGRLQAAGQSSSRAVDLALQEEEREEAASYQAARAVWEAIYGNAPKERGTPWRRSSFRRAGMSNTPPALPWPFRGILSIGSARRRSGKALPGGYFRQVYLRAGSSRVSRTRAGQARGQPGAAANRSSI